MANPKFVQHLNTADVKKYHQVRQKLENQSIDKAELKWTVNAVLKLLTAASIKVHKQNYLETYGHAMPQQEEARLRFMLRRSQEHNDWLRSNVSSWVNFADDLSGNQLTVLEKNIDSWFESAKIWVRQNFK